MNCHPGRRPRRPPLGRPDVDPTLPEVRGVQQGRPQQLPAAGQLHPLPAVHVPPAALAVPAGLQQLTGRDVLLPGVPAARGPDAVPHHDPGEIIS